jgi:lipopolysaccharide/colanic/teichoic acid biosynthesis glycosyltransferase
VDPLEWRGGARIHCCQTRETESVFDLVMAAVVLMVLLASMYGRSLHQEIDSSGPMLVRVPRTGKDGRSFSFIKFRTVYAGDPPPDVAWCQRLDAAYFHFNDPRTTRIGRFLRASNFDALPMLWNVVRGDLPIFDFLRQAV